jgi:alpha-L-rhamnosidase
MRGNSLSVPTDCPQRDERLGWTGDLALFAPTAFLIYDCFNLLNWLIGVEHDQQVLDGVPCNGVSEQYYCFPLVHESSLCCMA